MSIKAIIINRNLLSTLKNTVEFLRKEKRISEIHILDQDSSYVPLLEWYKTIPETVHYSKNNNGPYVAWSSQFNHLRDDYFIVTDPDCEFDEVPSDWLDKMLSALSKHSDIPKIGFSLKISDLPDSEIGLAAFKHEFKYWEKAKIDVWDADVDTTFALYRPNQGFTYNAARLDSPYSIKHIPWYLDVNDLPEEWKYYLHYAENVSTWGSKIKKAIK